MTVMSIGKFDLGETAVVSTSPPELADFALPLGRLVIVQKAMNWWVGDLVSMGESIHGDDFYSVVPEGFGADHIARCAAISSAIPRSSRLAELSWSHHREVARLDPMIQKALLLKALETGMTSGELREEVKKWKKR